MSSELLGSAENTLKGNLGGAWDILSGYADAYTDLGIGKQFGGAAAAYSLRDVGAMNGPVVRVRRDSDNSEQDFPASAVTQIPDWCNQSVIKPLDVRELNSGGSGDRDGNFVIAKAAYSLRSLGDRQAIIPNDESSPLNEDTNVPASGKYVVQVRRNVDGTIKSFTADEVADGTLVSFVNESFTSSLPLDVQGSAAAAYSLRNLSSTYSGAVVNVRRSSDDTTRDFTADSITNGSLVSFVNEEVLVNQTDASWTGWSDVGNASSSTSGGAITVTGATASESDGIRYNAFLPLTSNKYRFVFNVSALNLDGATSFQLKGNASNVVTSITSTGSYSVEHTVHSGGWGNFINFTLVGSPSSGASITIDSLQIYSIAGDGHVATWYDQSGNDNHATQTTADNQPKIVESGILNKDSDNNISVKFDSSKEHHLNNTTLPSSFTSSNTTFSDFTVQEPFQNNATGFVFGFGSTNSSNVRLNKLVHSGGSYGYQGFGSTAAFQSAFDTASYSANNVFLGSGLRVGTDLDIFKNSADADMNNTFDTGTLAVNTFAIGAYVRSTGVSSPFNGNITELIIYDTDQSTKRRAIEESIATNYSITLGSFSRDGMVRTWYDQSVTDEGGATATGNHAVQATAANQPKIVSSGSLVSNGIDFDGTNDVLETSLIPPNAATLIGVANWDVLNSTQLIVGARDSTNQRSYLGMQSSNVSVLGNQNSTLTGGSISAGANFVLFGVHDVGKRLISTNGTVVSNTDGVASNNTNQGYIIGGLNNAGTAASFLNGKIAEVIVYASDQTDNRGAFEANIAVHYGITAIPTAADPPTVNGFVETWYDQSGNGKDAIQTTATYQPKIVHEGSFNTDGGLLFDGDDTSLDSGSSTSLSTEFFVTGVMNLNTYVDENAAIITNAEAGGGDRLFIGTSDILRIRDDSTNISSSLVLSKTADNLFTYQASASSFTFVKNGTTDAKSALSGGQSYRYIGGGSGFNLSANMKELIIYSSDKTSDRTAIESNINNHYSIF